MRRTEGRWINFFGGVGVFLIGVAIFAAAPDPEIRRMPYILYVSAGMFVCIGCTMIWMFLAPIVRRLFTRCMRKMRAVIRPRKARRRVPGSKHPAPAPPALEKFLLQPVPKRRSNGIQSEPPIPVKPSHLQWESILYEIGMMRRDAQSPDAADALAHIEKQMQESRHRKPGAARYWRARAKAVSNGGSQDISPRSKP